MGVVFGGVLTNKLVVFMFFLLCSSEFVAGLILVAGGCGAGLGQHHWVPCPPTLDATLPLSPFAVTWDA